MRFLKKRALVARKNQNKAKAVELMKYQQECLNTANYTIKRLNCSYFLKRLNGLIVKTLSYSRLSTLSSGQSLISKSLCPM